MSFDDDFYDDDEYGEDDYYDDPEYRKKRSGSDDDDDEGRGISANAKWGIALIIELIIIVGLIFGLVRSYVHNKYSLLDVQELNKEELLINEGVNEEQMKGYTNIALFGVDARDSSLGAGNRSDAMLVASINNDTKEVKLVSVYRDTLLEIPDEEGAFTAKINASYAYGGAKRAVQALNSNLDLNITDFVTVNWEGLTRAIDAIGGVPIHVEENELDMLNACLTEQISATGIYSDGVFETGLIVLNGAQATAYSRIRSTDQGDITRTERQREVLTAVMEKMKDSDLSTIDKVIDEVFPYISTSMTEDEMIDLAKSVRSYKLNQTAGFPFQYQYYSSDTKGSCIAPEDLTGNVAALHRYLFGLQDYTPTTSVQRISNAISNETGFFSKGKVLAPGEESGN
ncbi:MAG: LCP family protein [Eubacterium sp.]|nr:LCP family protein [Eubacterium sp.]